MSNDISTYSLNAVAPAREVLERASEKVMRPADIQDRYGLAGPDEAPLTKDELAASAEEMNSLAQDLQRQLRFSVDDDSGEVIIKVVDQQTEELVRQIPAEEVLRLRQRLGDANGLIFQDSA